MLYRVRIDLAFDSKIDSDKLFTEAEKLLEKAVKIVSGDNPMGEVSFIETHRCYHDEDPTKPCEIIKRIEAQ